MNHSNGLFFSLCQPILQIENYCTVTAALDKGEILRTHLLRPTWHLVSAADIYGILTLTAPHIKAAMKSRNRELALSKTVFRKSNKVIEKSLRDGRHLTRKALIAELEKAGMATGNGRASHLLLEAELDGLVCSGATKGGKQTYALLEERVPRSKSLTKEEAMARLAGKYFTSHGPVTLQDFRWWSGLTVSEAKQALEIVKSDLISEAIAAQTYWFPDSVPLSEGEEESVYLLPAFDEFIISYKDRCVSLSPEDYDRVITRNGLFRPVVVVNGQVKGLWQRTIKKDKVVVEVKLFDPAATETYQSSIEKAARQFGQFLNKDVDLRFQAGS